MPRDSSGQYSLPPGTLVNSGDTVLPSQHNPAMLDIAQAISNSLPRSGAASMLSDLSMNNNRIRNVADGIDPSDVATVRQTQQGVTVPIGAVLDYWGSVIPDGYLLAAGQEVSRVDYAALFEAIGTTAGPGNGSTTFNVPDYRGLVSAGKADMGGTLSARLSSFAATVIGSIFGVQSVTLTVAQMPNHNHSGDTTTNGAHAHGLAARSGGDGANFVGSNTVNNNGTPNLSTLVAGEHAHNIYGEGGGQAHPNVQPTIICNKIIKVL